MLALAVGCQEEMSFNEVQDTAIETFYATFDECKGAETRTALDENNNVLWSKGDQISVFAGSTANNSDRKSVV